MPGFDWNGNGEHDVFDTFMDMKMVSDIMDENNSDYSDFDYDDTNCDDDICEFESTTGYSSTHSETESSTSSFQDELKQNLRSKEEVRNEEAQKALESRMIEAKYILSNIKRGLVQNAQNAIYTTENGVTTVSYIYNLPQQFLRRRHKDNGEQIRQNNKTNFLFRDPNLVYHSWVSFDIEPEYSSDFILFEKCLKELASKEKITLKVVIYDLTEGKVYPFPTNIPLAIGSYYLAVKASTSVSDNTDVSNSSEEKLLSDTKSTQDVPFVKEESNTTPVNTKESDVSILLKSIIIVVILCVIAFAICVSGNFGDLGRAVVLIGAAIGGYYILKS